MNLWSNFRFVLPMPTRANNLVRPTPMTRRDGKPGLRVVKTAEGKNWLALANSRLLALRRQLGNPPPIAGPVELHAKFFFPTIASDGDGPLKALQDAVKGFAWEDDRQIANWVLGKRILDLVGTAGDPIFMQERAEVMVVDVSEDPEHEELAIRLLEAKKRKATKPKLLLGLQPAVYR